MKGWSSYMLNSVSQGQTFTTTCHFFPSRRRSVLILLGALSHQLSPPLISSHAQTRLTLRSLVPPQIPTSVHDPLPGHLLCKHKARSMALPWGDLQSMWRWTLGRNDCSLPSFRWMFLGLSPTEILRALDDAHLYGSSSFPISLSPSPSLLYFITRDHLRIHSLHQALASASNFEGPQTKIQFIPWKWVWIWTFEITFLTLAMWLWLSFFTSVT